MHALTSITAVYIYILYLGLREPCLVMCLTVIQYNFLCVVTLCMVC